MSTLTYRGIGLSILHTREIVRETILSDDRQAYKFTRWVFDVDGVFNPMATSYARLGTNASLPRQQFGQMAGMTDAAVRHWLSQPRGRLTYTTGVPGMPGFVTLLDTPVPPYQCDVTGGPVVERCDVRAVMGDKTFLVSMRIVATVNEFALLSDPRAGGQPVANYQVLLSHRWRRSLDQDPDYFSVITTRGEAVFRLDELRSRGTVPDQYLPSLLPPIPTNFKRGPVRRIPSEDGTTLWYETTDRELPLNVRSNDVTRINAEHTRSMTEPSFALALAAMIPGTIRRAAGALQFAGPVNWGAIPASLMHAAADTVQLVHDTMPTAVDDVLVQCWGHRGTTRRRLQAFAVAVGLARVGGPTVAAHTSAHIRHSVTGKYAEFRMTHTRKLVSAAAAVVLGLFGFPAFQTPFDFIQAFPDGDATGQLLSPNDAANLAPPNAGRGSYRPAVQAAPLPQPNQLPPAWPNINANINQIVDEDL